MTARAETAARGGDPDDAAIWVHPAAPALSTIITTDKEYGLRVFDLDGRLLQELPDGLMNSVDVRGERVAASDRRDDSIALYAVDERSRRLVPAGRLRTGLTVYGLCLYRSARDGADHVFVNGKDGRVEQWRLDGDSGGRVVRRFDVGGQVEGCVADDALARLYVGEEDTGIWRYGAEPEAGAARVAVARADGVHLTADVEGLALFVGPGRSGYLLASSQGDDTVAVFRRDDGRFVARLRIAPGAVDGAEHTDGLAVTSAALGPRWPDGLLVVHDGEDSAGAGNFKLVSWTDVAAALPAAR